MPHAMNLITKAQTESTKYTIGDSLILGTRGESLLTQWSIDETLARS